MQAGAGATSHDACLEAGKSQNDGDEEEGAHKAMALHG